MGSLKYFNLKTYIDDFHLTGFVETGLGWGHGIQYAKDFDFQKLYSVEISKDVAKNYYDTFPFQDKIQIIISSSFEGLSFIFNQEKDLNRNFLIFLDAHFPAADLGLANFNDEKNNSLKYPLLDELKIIKENRSDKGFKDVIIIDDLSFYAKEDVFPDSHLRKHFNIEPPEDNDCLNKIINYFSETHDAQLVRRFSGFGIFCPKI